MTAEPQTAAPQTPDIKPRSREVTDGLERAAARGMLRAVGMGDDDWVKPQIGVASSWNEITPCNLSLQRLAQAAKEGVHAAGGYPLEFGTISVSDGISMGHEGMHFSLVSREVIADSVETVMQAERLDGVGAAGRLRQVAARHADGGRAARPRQRSSCTPGRSMPGQLGDKDVTIIDAFEAVGACARGLITRAEVDAIERAICPGEGACGGMYTANTMASVAEALGMSLPGSAAPPAVDRRRDGYARRSGEAVVELLRHGITARQIMTREAFENAIAVVMALGGSTNAVLHLLAIAREADVDLDARRLQPDRRPGAAPRRRQAVRPVRDDRRRPDRRRPGGDEGAARRRAAARRLPHGDRQDDGREPRRRRPARPRRPDHPRHGRADPRHRRDLRAQGVAGARGRGGEDGRLRRRRLRGHRPGLRAASGPRWTPWRPTRSQPATSW